MYNTKEMQTNFQLVVWQNHMHSVTFSNFLHCDMYACSHQFLQGNNKDSQLKFTHFNARSTLKVIPGWIHISANNELNLTAIKQMTMLLLNLK